MVDTGDGGRNYIGKLVNLNLDLTDGSKKFIDTIDTINQNTLRTNYQNQTSLTEAPFKYVLLEKALKGKSATGADEYLLNVYPVGDWFNFNKESVVKEKFLDAIQEDFEYQKELFKKKQANYRKIFKRSVIDDDVNADNDDEGDGKPSKSKETFSIPSLFSKAKPKKKDIVSFEESWKVLTHSLTHSLIHLFT